MRLTRYIALATALSVAAAPAFAAPPNPAAKLSLANSTVRAGVPMQRAAKARASTFVLAGLAVAAVVAAAVALGHNDNKRASM